MSWEASFHHRDFQGTFEIQTIIQTLFSIAVTKYQPKALHEGRVCFVSQFEVIMHPVWEVRAVGVGGSRSQCVHSQKEECWLSFSSLILLCIQLWTPACVTVLPHIQRQSPLFS